MEYFACGKLLLTAEYSVLRGAEALSLPTTFGQTLRVETTSHNHCHWESTNADGSIWFHVDFNVHFGIINTSDAEIANKLMKLLAAAKTQNPAFLTQNASVKTALNFDRNWGLGSSSTLVALVAQWAQVEALPLFFSTFSGSGYDVATALANSPILYHLKKEGASFRSITFQPKFTEAFYFLYLGKKQRSDIEVAKFGEKDVSPHQLDQISNITHAIVQCTSETHFIQLLEEHEECTSQIIGVPTIKQQLFPNYPKLIKSLGAWGGDFVLIHAQPSDLDYFVSRGYQTILPWKKMIAGS